MTDNTGARDALMRLFDGECDDPYASKCALEHLPALLAAAMEQEAEAGFDREFANWLCGYQKTIEARDFFHADPDRVAFIQERIRQMREEPNVMTQEELAKHLNVPLPPERTAEERSYPWRKKVEP